MKYVRLFVCSSVPKEFLWCFKKVNSVSHGGFKNILRVFQGCFDGRMFKMNFKGDPWDFQRN